MERVAKISGEYSRAVLEDSYLHNCLDGHIKTLLRLNSEKNILNFFRVWRCLRHFAYNKIRASFFRTLKKKYLSDYKDEMTKVEAKQYEEALFQSARAAIRYGAKLLHVIYQLPVLSLHIVQ